ncbi:MAG: hypothetical protein KKA79_04570 [Nanoarchaeota archaeon]|nr:hypothetical protein [Nanoarchaeota archaeon]MCG2718958.1 hypothetical protein [Nanoarchaeota archaeon]
MVKKFDSVIDLTGKNRKLDCKYHGSKNPHLEARILSDLGPDLVVGVSLSDLEIATHKYDKLRKSLDIEYIDFKGASAGLPYKNFDVPRNIQEINVYDYKQKP